MVLFLSRSIVVTGWSFLTLVLRKIVSVPLENTVAYLAEGSQLLVV